MSGVFITVEGIEGAGKSTNLAFIQDYLKVAGRHVLMTREPGGTTLGEAIRELVLQWHEQGMGDITELLLMFAARAEHLDRLIRPALAQGKWVVCDRFTDATYAYQGGGRGISRAHIAALEELVQGTLRPDLTLVLDVPADTGLQRARQRSTPDRFEQEELAFFQRVRDVYLQRAAEDQGRYRVIDARQPLEHVQSEIKAILDHFLLNH